jgi:hypothetical protein
MMSMGMLASFQMTPEEERPGISADKFFSGFGGALRICQYIETL